MIVIGVDPGATGALVAIGENMKILNVFDCPKDVDGFRALSKSLSIYKSGSMSVWIEEQRYIPKNGRQGGQSAFSLGRNYGYLMGFFLWMVKDCRIVPPQVWQRYHYGSGTVIADPKERSIRRARQLFPDLELVPDGCRVPRHGRADAALIAAYGAAVVKEWQNA